MTPRLALFATGVLILGVASLAAIVLAGPCDDHEDCEVIVVRGCTDPEDHLPCTVERTY